MQSKKTAYGTEGSSNQGLEGWGREKEGEQTEHILGWVRQRSQGCKCLRELGRHQNKSQRRLMTLFSVSFPQI